MSYSTIRPKNKCNRCYYRWYPRGKNLSQCCPRCKSKDVEIVTAGPIERIVGMMFVLFVVYAFLASGPVKNKNTGDYDSTSNTQKQSQHQPKEIVHTAYPKVKGVSFCKARYDSPCENTMQIINCFLILNFRQRG